MTPGAAPYSSKRLHSRGTRCPSFARTLSLRKQREQGMPDARCTRGLVCKGVRECAHEHTGQRRTSDIPCAMALRLISRSPRRIRAFVASVAPRKPARRPGRAFRASARLDANHRGVGSTRFCRTLQRRSSARRSIAHGVDPALPPPARPTLPRPPHPRPAFRDDHDTPLREGRDGTDIDLIWVGGKGNISEKQKKGLDR